ncbi:MAG: hypothetical protein M0Z76_02610 [Gammaproteobacteria bacterium]|nr:hypothetical protein [Gammaproteobacteria bacterium]
MLMIDCKVGERLLITLDTAVLDGRSLQELAAGGPIEVIVARAGARSVRLAVSAPAAFCLRRTARARNP